MIWHTISFIWREALLELRRERLIAMTTVSTVAVLLVLLGANLLFVTNLRVWAERASREVVVTAYFQDRLERSEAQRAAQDLATWPDVQSVRFVTREELWQRFSQSFDADKLRGLGPSVFQDSVEVKVKRAALVPAVAKRIATRAEVKNVIPSADKPSRAGSLLQSILHFNRVVRGIGLFVAALVAVVGLFVVHNTVRLALHARWREIYIMQLVGATRSLIAAPFLLQGAIQGALGAALAACLLVPGHMYLGAAIIASKRAFLELQPDALLLPFALKLVVGGFVLGLLGSALSLHRALRHRPEWQT